MKMKVRRRDEGAARWYVAAIDQPAGTRAERRMLAWLERDSSNADALGRCEAAVEIAKNLSSDPEAGWAFREAHWLASAGRSRPNRLRRWLASPVFAWSIAGACAALALFEVPQMPNNTQPDAAVPALPDARAAQPTALPDAPDTLALALVSAHPVVVLPGNIVVDANSLAILPFSSGTQTAAGTAARLHDDLVSALASVPGLYPAGGETVAAYAGSALPVAEIAAQLGTRGVVTGTVAMEAGRLSVCVSLTDASTGRVLLEAGYQRSAGDLHALEREMASAIALALAHATRPPVTASR
jgi:TolB-like protein